MSRIVKVSNGDYRLQVQAGGNIIFDTTGTVPNQTTFGTVTIWGNLDIKGVTNTIESTNTQIKDNIIQLNYGQTGSDIGNGSGTQTSGIEIERCTYSAAQWVFKETVSHWDASTNTQKTGTWVGQTADNALSAAQLTTIVGSGVYNLTLDMMGGNGIVSVANSLNYENRVLNDNDIPNKKYVNQYVAAVNGQAIVSSIFYPIAGTVDTSVATTATTINMSVGSTVVAVVSAGGLTVSNINISGDTISDTSSNNLVLTATNNNVEVNAVLNIDNQSVAPSYIAGKTKIYSQTAFGPGNTGVYIANATASDELISRRRAVLLSILL